MTVIIPREGNPLYPLPADYQSLTADGKRKARINACRQWREWHDDAHERGLRLVASTRFFDQYYLHPDEEQDFDPGFYEDAPLASPPMHDALSMMWAGGQMNLAVLPRGAAKSTHTLKDVAMRVVSAPKYSVVYVTGSNDNALDKGKLLRRVCYDNDRVHNDWSPEYGVSMIPPRTGRGAGLRGVQNFDLGNLSRIRCTSAESRLRSIRPSRFKLDDPEYDERSSTPMEVMRENLAKALFRVMMPTVMHGRDKGLDWTATFVSRKHFAYAAASMVDGPGGTRVAEDERFDLWNRLIVKAAYEQDGKLHSVWPEMWPADEDERERLQLPQSRVTLEFIRKSLGDRMFNSEYMALLSGDDQFFNLDREVHGRHAWWVEDADTPDWFHHPLTSIAKMCYRDRDGVVQKIPLREFHARCRWLATVDTAYTENASSDRRAVCVHAISPDGCRFVMDMWSDRKSDRHLQDNLFRLCHKWAVPIVFVEVVRESKKLYKRLELAVRDHMVEDPSMRLPAIKPYNPGMASKTEKISTLDLWFDQNLIKIPLFRKRETTREPWWSRLVDQIEGFQAEARDGGLKHDDELDTVQMGLECSGRRRKFEEPLKPTQSLDALIERGVTDVNGMDVLSMVNPQTASTATLFRAMELARKPTRGGTKA